MSDLFTQNDKVKYITNLFHWRFCSKFVICYSFPGLNICGVDCVLTAEWKSSSKIIARSGPGKGKGDVTVITKSGGVGSCTVGFKGYFVQIGKTHPQPD
jgi:hypothetical protein